MKVTYLKIKNIGLVAEQTIEFNLPLILLYGQIRQGKTTYLNCVRWVCGGSFPDDIIRHGEKEASIELGFSGGSISREFYLGKDKTTKAREVVFVRNGRPVSSPVAEIKRFLNPFLLDQDYLRKMNDAERKRYFVEMFGVDTAALDTEAFNAERQAAALRATVKGYGEIAPVEVAVEDVAPLRAELAKVREAHNAAIAAVAVARTAAQSRESAIERQKELQAIAAATLVKLKAQIADIESDAKECADWLKEHPPLAVPPSPQPPDTAEIEARISNAAANNVRAEQYAKDKKRLEQKQAEEKALAALELRLREIKKEKAAKLKDIAASAKIEGLAFDETGSFTYQGTDAGMLSTSQVMRLSSELSALYPEGFGLDLIDRGESLGASIFEFVERAKAEDITILATIVGEAPAKVPSDVGVFVVAGGKAEKR